jgi:hypothetical protein
MPISASPFPRTDSLGRALGAAVLRARRCGGRKGGPARALALTPERRTEIARQGALARWGLPA